MGLTQEQFANLIGVVSATVNFWERGIVKPTGLSKRELTKLFEAQGANLSEDAPKETAL